MPIPQFAYTVLVSTGCLIHLNALGWDLKRILDILIFFSLAAGCRLFPIVGKHALAVKFLCNVLLDHIIYFLQHERPLRITRIVNGQQAEKKLALAEIFMFFVFQQSFKKFCASMFPL